MNFYTRNILILIILLISYKAYTQEGQIRQAIYGIVSDKFNERPLIGVNISLSDTSIITGTITNQTGKFIIENIEIGDYKISFHMLGYKSYEQNIRLTSGKALDLNIRLEESVENLGEVSVNAFRKKDQPLNDMALIGARSFSIEETNRYAGSYGDPARMAINYAGVLPVRDNRNDIIIRGNTSTGLQWRVDGIHSPNPNHFGASGTTGGPITIINTNLISNSDFFNGTFPAEYGNALAGVFDIKLRPGNSEKIEQWAQLGWNGLEYGIEGPINKQRNSSYIASYRYSVVDLITKMGIPLNEAAAYQDLSFKFNFPGTKTGNWSIIGLGGKSEISITESDKDTDKRTFITYGEDVTNVASMGVFGISHRVYPGKNSKLQSSASITGSTVKNTIDTFSVSNMNPYLWGSENTEELKLNFNTNYRLKVSKKTNISAGIDLSQYIVSYHDKQFYKTDYLIFTDLDNKRLELYQGFIDLKHHFSNTFQMYLGLHNQYFAYNNSYNIEPRYSLKKQLNENHSISFGTGLHSQIQPLMVYFIQTENGNQEISYTNADLELTKTFQNGLGYDFLIKQNLRLKTELYYQYLYDVPVSESQPEYSLINFGTEYYVERKDSLANEGTGENYGIEITLEQFFNKNYFYLFTVSIFNSTYTTTDKVKRNTAYNGNYALNFITGYERPFPKKNVSIIFGVNLTYAGGSPYVPFHSEETVNSGYIAYDWSKAYKVSRPNYKRASIRIGFRRNKKKFRMESTIDLQYRTNYTSIYYEKINILTGEIVNTNKMGFYPMANLKFNF